MKVMIFGTFDGLHEGHLNFFRQAREYGNYLIAVAGRDSNIKKIKKHLPKRSENQRLEDLKNCKLINEARLGYKNCPYKIIDETKPDVICLGYDQLFFIKGLKEKLKEFELKPEIHRMEPYKPKKYHSSLINK